MRGWSGARAAQTRGSLCGAGRRRPVLAPAVAASQSLGCRQLSTHAGRRKAGAPVRAPAEPLVCRTDLGLRGAGRGGGAALPRWLASLQRPARQRRALCQRRPPAPRPAPPSCPPRPPRHCWRRPPATSALGVGFASSPCAPRQNARNLVEGLRLICPCAQCVVMSVQQSRCLINNY